MTREHAKKYLSIIQAFANGETVQWQDCTGDWNDVEDPLFTGTEYRIKPMPREWWQCEICGQCHYEETSECRRCELTRIILVRGVIL